ncbi:hypothetical protein C8R45DRAFT_428365 [Mycena sanguinolenta]|nr:hypothetical protein C8R45DRAFT_428365 [Mycena sanguinolenta]
MRAAAGCIILFRPFVLLHHPATFTFAYPLELYLFCLSYTWACADARVWTYTRALLTRYRLRATDVTNATPERRIRIPDRTRGVPHAAVRILPSLVRVHPTPPFSLLSLSHTSASSMVSFRTFQPNHESTMRISTELNGVSLGRGGMCGGGREP